MTNISPLLRRRIHAAMYMDRLANRLLREWSKLTTSISLDEAYLHPAYHAYILVWNLRAECWKDAGIDYTHAVLEFMDLDR